ncbi:MAG TPA: metallopeptidase TldD-related protein [bacterium]
MEKLLEQARKSARDAEIYNFEQSYDALVYENSRLKNVYSSMQSGTSLRLIKDSHIGFAYTRNRENFDQMVQNALASMREGVVADFAFPSTKQVKELATYDQALEKMSCSELAAECERVIGFLSKLTKAQLDVYLYRQAAKVHIINSAGTDIAIQSTSYNIGADLSFPGTRAAICGRGDAKGFMPLNGGAMEQLAEIYNASTREVTPPGGRMEILFVPEEMYTLIWRLKSAMNGRSVYKKESPVINKLGQQIFDPKFSAYDDPLDDRYTGARSFDDEGTPCRKLDIVENGCIKNFYYDLNYAAKMKTSSTGHGYRSAMWSVDPVSTRPAPCLNHFFIKTGDKSFEQLIKTMRRGIIVFGCLGAHSGNIPNGDFSIGLSPGLYVENGEIRGRVKNTMISGNIYDLMKNIIDIENIAHPAYEGVMPAILFESAMVAVQ